MTRTIIVISLTILAAAGCRRNEPPAPEAKSTANVAQTTTVVGAPGNLANEKVEVTIPLRPNAVSRCVVGSNGAEKKTFAPGEPIQLTLGLAEAPEGLKVAARLIDDKEQVVAHVTEPASGKKEVVITINRKLERGTYRLEGYWGGNVVCEHSITIGK